jgi:uncharacterized protein (TIGR03435 family)
VKVVLIVLLTHLLAVALGGQNASTQPKFEVASVKQSSSPPYEYSGVIRVRADGLSVARTELKSLIQWSYDVKRYQITDGPNWLESEFFAIEAKAQGPTTRENLKLMLRALLAERFRLTLHPATKELPVYALTVAKGGPKLREVEAGKSSPQAMVRSFRDGQRMLSRLTGSRTFMWQVVDMLSGMLSLAGRPVVDRTGLKGCYDFTLEWDPNESAPGDDTTKAQVYGPSLFSAIQEQLGLRLDAQRSPVSVLVIDHAERVPTEN